MFHKTVRWPLGGGLLKNVNISISLVLIQRRRWHSTPVLLPGKSHGWRSLVGCSPWGREESDMTEQLHFHFSLSCIGEGNGNPLQCSCLENPRDGEAWWAAVYGVAQSRTRLRWLSSSTLSLPGYPLYLKDFSSVLRWWFTILTLLFFYDQACTLHSLFWRQHVKGRRLK